MNKDSILKESISFAEYTLFYHYAKNTEQIRLFAIHVNIPNDLYSSRRESPLSSTRNGVFLYESRCFPLREKTDTTNLLKTKKLTPHQNVSFFPFITNPDTIFKSIFSILK